MARKIIAVFTLGAFSLFLASCVYRTVQLGPEAVAKKGKSAKVLSVQTKAGQYFEFGKARPAHVKGGAVVGELLNIAEFDRKDIANFVAPSDAAPGLVVTKDGKRYTVYTAHSEGDELVCQAYLPISIPCRDIQLAWVKYTDTGASILQVVGAVLVIGLIVAILAVDEEIGSDFAGSLLEPDIEAAPAPAPPPPPAYRDFVQSNVIDAELHGATAGQGFTITEWTAVDCAPDPAGGVKFLFGNELNEPKSTDQLNIFVVDHPMGSTVIPDLEGTMHTVSALVKPQKATDQRGRDILPLVAENDKLLWTSPEDVRDPKKEEDLRDELVFEFPKPKRAKSAKLVVNATNTMWASIFAGRFLGIPGASPLKSSDPAHPDMSGGRARDWYREEEFYKLQVWVETKAGWSPRQVIYGGGPFVPRDKVCGFDIGDVSGPTLRIKLLPPANFWMIDRLAVDFGKDQLVDVHEVDPVSATATGLTGEDVLSALAEADGRYLDLPTPGDKVEVSFLTPPLKRDLTRSVFLRTVSRYEIRPAAPGAVPSAEIAGKMTGEPGFAARYALEEYQKWEAGLRARLKKAGLD